MIPDLEVIPVKTLAALFDDLSGRRLIESYIPLSADAAPQFFPTDFAEIKGQEHVKRALEIAVAGSHNCLDEPFGASLSPKVVGFGIM